MEVVRTRRPHLQFPDLGQTRIQQNHNDNLCVAWTICACAYDYLIDQIYIYTTSKYYFNAKNSIRGNLYQNKCLSVRNSCPTPHQIFSGAAQVSHGVGNLVIYLQKTCYHIQTCI